MAGNESFRFVTEKELPSATESLGDLIGHTEAAQQCWQRRLCVVDGVFGLMLQTPALMIRQSDVFYAIAPEVEGGALTAWLRVLPLAFPLAEGVALLQSEANPEAEIERRRLIVEKRNSTRAEIAAKRQRASDQAAEANRESTDFRQADWERGLTELGRFATGLALLVEKRDPALANDLRGLVANGSQSRDGRTPSSGLRFPRLAWWPSPTSVTDSEWWLSKEKRSGE
jgi:hypothetical protein